MSNHKDYPLEVCVAEVDRRIDQAKRLGVECNVYQKWTCQHCNARQTMEEKNVFFRAGNCEECKKTTLISKCNYMMHLGHGTK